MEANDGCPQNIKKEGVYYRRLPFFPLVRPRTGAVFLYGVTVVIRRPGRIPPKRGQLLT